MTADEEVWLHEWQTPTGRALVVRGESGYKPKHAQPYVYVLSECCRAEIDADNRQAQCKACDEILAGRCDYSSSFPLAAFKMKRSYGYWFGWGEQWFGWKEFNFEVTE